MADQAARFRISVLILGDTGVGKEVLARRIHRRSPRSGRPIVCIDCASLCPALVESELFGHERGAFTGAERSRSGLLEIAEGGTVFLDEIGELPLAIQSKLLRVLETRTIMRVGGTSPRDIDVRFVAATNRNLDLEVAEGRFRADLLYRLDGIRLTLPPLRQRTGDVLDLARAFLAEASEREGVPAPILSSRAIDDLLAHSWPGNLRELRNSMDRALVLCDGQPIEPHHLLLDGQPAWEGTSAQVQPTHQARVTEETTGGRRQLVVAALASCGGNQGRTARLLGVSRRTLVTWLDKLGLPRPRKRAAQCRPSPLDHRTPARVTVP